jgi:FkbM family methyltransferase
LDIGTAEGLFPLTVIDKCKHIWMVEPSSTFYKCLKNTFYDFTNKVSIYNSAVGNQDGTILFNEENENTQKISISKIDSLFKN